MEPLVRLKKIVSFCSPAVLTLLALGLVTGVALFFVELFLSVALQAFLVVLGLLSPEVAKLPSWMPVDRQELTFGIVLLIGVSRAFLQGVQLYLQSATFERFRVVQRARLLRWSYLSQAPNGGEVTSLFNEYTTAAGTVLSAGQALLGQLVVGMLLCFKLFSLAPVPTAFAVVAVGLIGLAVKFLDRTISRAGSGLSEEAKRINTRLFSGIKNLLLLQIYGMARVEAAQAEENLHRFYRHTADYNKALALKFMIPQAAGILVLCIIGLFVGRTHGRIAGSVDIAYFYLFIRFVQNFSEAAKNGSTILYFLPGTRCLAKWWADHSFDGLRNRRDLGPTRAPRRSENAISWRVEDISFGYPGQRPLIEHLRFEVPPKQLVTILGPSGSGKTTLLNILLGLQQPNSGRIVTNLATEDLLFNIGYVGADSFLIDGTVRDNLLYGLAGHPRPDESAIQTALRQAECQFVFDSPDYLDHRITEQGQGLSAGQKQRLALARALLRNPKALILDEATANLDFYTEKKLLVTFNALKQDMTIIAVTHRTEILQYADQCINL